MKKLGEGKSLKWEQTGKLSSHLVSADGEVATLEWATRWGSLATAASADGSWTLKRAGFLRPRVTAREKGSDSDYAVVTLEWHGGGSVAFSDGEAFTMKRSGLRHPEWSIFDSARKKLLTLRPNVSWKKRECPVSIADGGASGRTVFLAVLAWYVILLTDEYDSTAATTAAVLVAAGA